ncbi:hypothetical protein ACH4SP_41840 [Streptomyces sp. NPDC021093]|uniref:hypothetical protein n=1 Tax=Streptomyces sp. NPDC021093 TaxID=3365112 RepID=UPI0037B6A058
MHPDTFRHLHAARSAELRQQAAVGRQARSAAREDTSRHPAHTHRIRTQLGWALVELGLRLVRTTAAATTTGEHRLRTTGTA